ncbi:MAG: HVO_0476 family zinc finger protein [Methanomassiliicoccales archaeon]|jgi:uncharacterized Zn finger protein
MTVPNALFLECPSCGEHCLHEVLRGRIGGKKDVMETTVKCQKCGHVHSEVVSEPKAIKVPIIVSEFGKSKRSEIELGSDEVLSVEEELLVGDAQVVVTSIESEDRRVDTCPVGKIGTIWAKKFDKVRVKISINKVSKTIPAEVVALPEEEFYVGDLMTVGKHDVVIHNIKTRTGTVREGGAQARDIVRIYAKSVRTTYA